MEKVKKTTKTLSGITPIAYALSKKLQAWKLYYCPNLGVPKSILQKAIVLNKSSEL
jgi:hypothetical protein